MNIAYVGLGFAAVFLGLELAWHFTACKIHDKSINLFLQASWLIEIERDLIIMTSIEPRRIRRTLNIKTNPTSSEVIEVERIIRRDGFNYFLIANE